MTEQNGSQLNPSFNPKCILDYNRGMIGIDRQDQILAYFPVMRKSSFTYLIWYLLIHTFYTTENDMEKKQNYTKYKPQIAETLLQNVPLQDYKRRGQLSDADIPMRLYEQH